MRATPAPLAVFALLLLVALAAAAPPTNILPVTYIGSFIFTSVGPVTMITSGMGGASAASGIAGSLCQIKSMIDTILPTVALTMLLLSGLVYAAGQAFGAEMKAKAQGWAMAILVGAIIGILLSVLAPFLLNVFSAGKWSAAVCK